MMVEVKYLGTFLLGPERDPAILFYWEERNRVLPVFVGLSAGSVLSSFDAGIEPRRPDAVAVLSDILEAHDDEVESITIDACNHGIFYSTIHCSSGNSFDIRTSDAVELALTVETSISAPDSLLRTYAVPVTEELLPHITEKEAVLSEHGLKSCQLLERAVKKEQEHLKASSERAESLGDLAVGDADFEELMGHLGLSEEDFASGDDEH